MDRTPTDLENKFNIQKPHEKYKKSEKDTQELFKNQIEKSGFQKQNEFLVEKGFTDLKKNFKGLFKQKGDEKAALEKLMKKSQKKQDQLEKFKEFDAKFSKTALKIEKETGFPQKKAIKLLAKFEGDESKVTNEIKKKSEKKDLEKIQITKAFNEYQEQMKFLISNNQFNLKKNVKFLERAEGDQVKALDMLSKHLKEKKEKKPHEKKERNEEAEKHLTREWQDCISTLVIDGNNCLYADNDLRGELKKNQISVETKILKLAERFSAKKNLKELILYYDDSKLKYEAVVEGIKVRVITARPQYKTADDAIVEMKDKLEDNTVYVTSDRGLHQRLIEKNSKFVMKSGAFFKIAQEVLGEEYSQIVKA